MTILDRIRADLTEVSGGDPLIRFAMNRFVQIRLMHDERGTPMQRRKLKPELHVEQDGRCRECGSSIPIRNSVLDRAKAEDGYVHGNVELVCSACDRARQPAKNFS